MTQSVGKDQAKGKLLAYEMRVREATLDIVMQAIADGADLTATDGVYGRTALHWASSHGFLEIAEALIDAGADLTHPSTDGVTPLMYAARHGHEQMVQEYLRRKAPLDVKDHADCTAVHHAAQAGQAEMVQLLVDLCPDLLHGKNKSGKTAHNLASEYIHGKNAVKMIDMLTVKHAPNDELLKTKSPVRIVKLRPRGMTL